MSQTHIISPKPPLESLTVLHQMLKPLAATANTDSENPVWLTDVQETRMSLLGSLHFKTCPCKNTFVCTYAPFLYRDFPLRLMMSSRRNSCLWTEVKKVNKRQVLLDVLYRERESGPWLSADECAVLECGPWGFWDTSESHVYDIISLRWAVRWKLPVSEV